MVLNYADSHGLKVWLFSRTKMAKSFNTQSDQNLFEVKLESLIFYLLKVQKVSFYKTKVLDFVLFMKDSLKQFNLVKYDSIKLRETFQKLLCNLA